MTSKRTEKFQHLLPRPLVPGQVIFDYIPESWKGVSQNILSSLVQVGQPATLEASHVGNEGEEIHHEFYCIPVDDGDGQLAHIFIQVRDVTAQKIFEKKITILAREYQSLIENANAVIIGLDVRGYIIDWNEMAAHVTGYLKTECYTRKLADFLEPHSGAAFDDKVQEVLNGAFITNHEMTLLSKQGALLTLLMNATPKISSDGHIVGILCIGQDITELSAYRKSLEQKVLERTKALKSALEKERQLVEVKDRFVSMASHEFRSPITYIHRNIGTIKSNITRLEPADVLQRLSKIESHADHLLSLLEDVLTIGKSGANTIKLKANFQSVDLKEFLSRVVDEVASNTQHTHRIKLDFPDAGLFIRSDENLLRNIFVNLLTNAIKFSPGKDEVVLSVRKVAGQVECRVADHGLGIGKQDLPKIFEPFHRGENVQTIKGTGLGLPIVKKAVETLGGEVGVESQPGQGTIFTVQLNLQ